jgi:hypothetical protein
MAGPDTGTRVATTEVEEYLLRSYRYLRLAIVVLLTGLTAGLIGHIVGTHCIEGSISAYYYTPAHGLFIGSLVATGASMVALKGRTTVEDTFFNVAGMLAPVVALVPTTRQDKLCDGSRHPLSLNRDDLIPNSLLALIAASCAILAVTVIVAKRRDVLKVRARSLGRSLRTGVAPVAALMIGALVATVGFDVPLYSCMHFGAAIGLFASIYLAIGSLLSERLHRGLHLLLTWKSPTDHYRKPDRFHYRLYRVVLLATLPFAALAAVSGRAWIFWVEAVGIASFVAFWITQTDELWHRLPDSTSDTRGAAPCSTR